MNTIPKDDNAEQGLLAYYLLYPNNFQSNKVNPDYFYSYRNIYIAMNIINDQGRVIDLSTLAEQVTFQTALEVSQWTPWTPAGAIKRLEDMYFLRTIGSLAHKLTQLVFSPLSTISEATSILNELSAVDVTKQDIVTVQEAEEIRTEQVRKKIEARNAGKILTGDPTGFPFLDEATDGVQPATYMVVVGQSSAGKSAFINNMTAELIKQGKHIEMMTFEMPPEIYNTRLLSILSKVAYSKIDKGLCTLEETEKVNEAIELISNSNFRYRTNENMQSILRTLKQLEKSDVEYVFIDYLQNISFDDESEYRAYKKFSLELRSWTRRTRKKIVLVSQLSNENINSIKKSETQAKGAGDVKAHSTHFIELSNYFDKEKTLQQLSQGRDRAIVINLDKQQTGRRAMAYYLYHGDNYSFMETSEEKLKEQDVGHYNAFP